MDPPLRPQQKQNLLITAILSLIHVDHVVNESYIREAPRVLPYVHGGGGLYCHRCVCVYTEAEAMSEVLGHGSGGRRR